MILIKGMFETCGREREDKKKQASKSSRKLIKIKFKGNETEEKINFTCSSLKE